MRNLQKDPLRIGIIGCGSFVQRRILPALKEVDTIKVVCIQKRDPQEAAAIAQRFNIPYTTSERDELLSCPEVEAVFIASRNHLHAEDAIACAKAMKPALCEKPLAPTVKEIEQMLLAFKQSSTPFYVGHSLRFKSFAQIAKDLLQQGKMGELRSIRAHFCIPLSSDSWRFDKMFGGGALQDLGVHVIDLIHFITGESIQTIQAIADVGFQNKGQVEKTVAAICRLSGGAIASFECSIEQPLHSMFEIVGSRSRLLSCNSLRQTEDPVESLCHIMEDDSHYYYPLKASNVYVDELKHFASSAIGLTPAIIPAEIGLINQKVIEAAYASIGSKAKSTID